MNKQISCDIAIIGAGSGGLSLAAGASQLGAKVVLIEKNKMGGDCLNTGCVPSKSLLAAAKNYWKACNSSELGTHINSAELDFQKAMAHVKKVISTIAVHDSVERFEGLGVKVIKAQAQFVDKKIVNANDYEIHAKKIVIATGSYASIPPIKGIDDVSYLTNETIFDIKTKPTHLIVIGAGPIGCELAQAFAMFGCKVTLLEGLNLLNNDEPDCAKIIAQSLFEKGVDIHEGIVIESVNQSNEGITVNCENSMNFSGSHLLVATGRTPNVDGLNLTNASIDFNSKGIIVNNKLMTSNKHVYAIGDVAGAYQFTHVANYHAGIVLRSILFKLPAKVSYGAIPWVTYTTPELAHVGKTVNQCQMLAIEYKVFELNLTENDRALTQGDTKGTIKLIVDKKARVLGVTIVAENAGELLLPWVMMINEKKTLRSLTDVIVAYPTLSEISKRVAGEYYKPKLFSPFVKKMVRFLLKI
jgi:pyruvate/2-oxoglutarate dehydrogenase complex dihydrolipoamide dehydrogenase (E3) component